MFVLVDPRRTYLVMMIAGAFMVIGGALVVIDSLLEGSWRGALREIWLPLVGGALVVYGYQQRRGIDPEA